MLLPDTKTIVRGQTLSEILQKLSIFLKQNSKSQLLDFSKPEANDD